MNQEHNLRYKEKYSFREELRRSVLTHREAVGERCELGLRQDGQGSSHTSKALQTAHHKLRCNFLSFTDPLSYSLKRTEFRHPGCNIL